MGALNLELPLGTLVTQAGALPPQSEGVGTGHGLAGGPCQHHSPSLVKVDQEDHVVPEAGQPVGGGHGDDEGKDVVDEGVEGLEGVGRAARAAMRGAHCCRPHPIGASQGGSRAGGGGAYTMYTPGLRLH